MSDNKKGEPEENGRFIRVERQTLRFLLSFFGRIERRNKSSFLLPTQRIEKEEFLARRFFLLFRFFFKEPETTIAVLFISTARGKLIAEARVMETNCYFFIMTIITGM